MEGVLAEGERIGLAAGLILGESPILT